MNPFLIISFVILINAINADRAPVYTLTNTEKGNLWNRFKGDYQKKYDNSTNILRGVLPSNHETRRRAIFEKNLETINSNNEKYNRRESSAVFAINKFSDLSTEEFASAFLTLQKPGPTLSSTLSNVNYVPSLRASVLPASIDWRNVSGYVNPIRDQGSCGSCWAFSAVASLEGQYKRYTGNSVQLSEQNLVDCVYTTSGCDGGWMPTAWDYIRKNKGINKRASYGYTAKYSRSCKFKTGTKNLGAKDNGTVYVTNGTPDEDKLITAIATVGPISVAVDATYFQFYLNGVYTDTNCNVAYVNHAVNVVGYTSDYFIVRNSWGTSWGEAGYIRMKRGSNLCGIASYASYPLWIPN